MGSIGTGLLIDHVNVRALFNVQATGFAMCGIATYFAVDRPREHLATAAGPV